MSYYIGIDIGGTTVKAGVVDSESAKIVAKASVPTPQCGGEGFCAACMDAVNLAIEKAKVKASDIECAGIGAPGISDKKTGTLLYVGTINYGENGAPVVPYISSRMGNIPVYLENDANVAAIGEYYAKKKEKDDTCFVFITIGTGVGGGVIIGGKLFVGANGAGAEIGHIVTHKDGRECSCGRVGCYEAYASMTALIKNAKEVGKDLGIDGEITGKSVFDAADRGNAVAAKLIDDWVCEIAEGVADMINVFQPEEISIGGAVSAQGERLLAPIRKLAGSKDLSRHLDIPHTAITAATLGGDAGIIGAAFLKKAL